MPIGTATAYVMDDMWFRDVPKEDFRKTFDDLMVFQAMAAAFAWCTLNIFFREQPVIPPSVVATVPYENLNFLEAFKALKENHNFLLLIIAYGLIFGSYIAIGTLVSNLFDPFGYDVSDLSYVCLRLLGAGVIGAIVVGAVIDQTQDYKSMMGKITLMIAASTYMVIATLKN